MDYGAALEMRFAATRRGFESRPLRQILDTKRPRRAVGRGGVVVRDGQYTETPYTWSASVTGWKNVVPPRRQSPLPPEVRPTAEVPE